MRRRQREELAAKYAEMNLPLVTCPRCGYFNGLVRHLGRPVAGMRFWCVREESHDL